MGLIKKLLVFNFLLVCVSSKSLSFDFEDATESENFELTCNGLIGAWTIVKTNSAGTPLPDAGNWVLTVPNKQVNSCLQSSKTIKMNKNQKITIDYFRKKPSYADPYESNVYLKCDSEYQWKFLIGDEPLTTGEWKSVYHTFPNTETNCKVQLQLYIGNGQAEVEIDRIILDDLPSTGQCRLE